MAPKARATLPVLSQVRLGHLEIAHLCLPPCGKPWQPTASSTPSRKREVSRADNGEGWVNGEHVSRDLRCRPDTLLLVVSRFRLA